MSRSTRRRSSPRCGRRPGRAAGWRSSPSCASPATRAPICSTSARCWRRRPRRWTRSRSRRRGLRSPSSSGCRWRWTAGCSTARRCIAEGGCWASCPKPICPTTNEFYEERWFTSASLAIRGDGRDRRAGGAVRQRSALRRRQSAGLHDRASRSARTCGRSIRPAATWRWPARRCCSTARPATSCWARSTTAATWCASSRRAAWRPISTPGPGRANRRPTWSGPGTR